MFEQLYYLILYDLLGGYNAPTHFNLEGFALALTYVFFVILILFMVAMVKLSIGFFVKIF